MAGTMTQRISKVTAASVAALVAATTVAALMPAPTLAASGPTSIGLPLSGFGGSAVDGAHQHVFISSPADNAVLVTGYSGNVVTEFTGLAGASRLALDGSWLFVLDPTAGAIERIDTTTLTDDGVLASGLVEPADLAAAGGRLWTTTNGCTQFGTEFVAVDETTGAETTYPAPTQLLAYCAGFATTPANPNLLIAWDAGLEPSNLTELNVGGGGAPQVVLDQRESNVENLRDLAVSPDGTTLYPASGYPYEIDQYSAANLAATGLAFPLEPYPDAVATTAAQGGLMAAGVETSSAPEVAVFSAANPAAETTYSFGNVWARGLAFSPDGSHLFAVTGAPNPGAATVQLNVVTYGPTPAPATVDAPSMSLRYGAVVPVSFPPTYAGLPAGTSPATPATCTTTAVTGSPAGSYPITCSGAADPSYSFSYAAGTLTISRALVGVAGPAVSLSFAAAVPASFPPLYSGLVNEAAPATGASCTTTARQGSAPGSYPIACAGAADPNYSFSYSAGSLAITKGATSLSAATLWSSGLHPAATLTRTLDGAPIAAATITFTVGKKTCTGVTNPSGTATCKAMNSSSNFTASFAGNADYLGSNASGSLF